MASSVGNSSQLKNPRIKGDCDPSSKPNMSEAPAGPAFPVVAKPP